LDEKRRVLFGARSFLGKNSGWILLRESVVLQGYFEKIAVSLWCFCGEFVVRCVAHVDGGMAVFRRLKMGQGIQLFFSVWGLVGGMLF
jgi:hypothetical protein